MKPESWSGWFPLKSSPTGSYRWLHCDFQKYHANTRTALLELYVLTGPSHLANWSAFHRVRITLRMTASQWVCLGVEPPLWTFDVWSVWVWNLLYCLCGAPSLGVEVEVTLRLIVSQSVCLGIDHPCSTCDQILLNVGMLLSEICGLVSVGRPLWREDASAICSVITQWSESPRTRNHTLLPHLRLPQPGVPGSHIYVPQEQGDPAILPGTRFPLRHLLRLAGLRWRYSNPPATWRDRSLYI
jgi:hypothetical protein